MIARLLGFRTVEPQPAILAYLHVVAFRHSHPVECYALKDGTRAKIDRHPFILITSAHPYARILLRGQQVLQPFASVGDRYLEECPIGCTCHLQLKAQVTERHSILERHLQVQLSCGKQVVVAVVLVRVAMDRVPCLASRQGVTLHDVLLLPSFSVVRGQQANAVALRCLVGAIGHRADNPHSVGFKRKSVPRILQPCVATHDMRACPVIAVDGAFALAWRQLAQWRGRTEVDHASFHAVHVNESIGQHLSGHIAVERRRLHDRPSTCDIVAESGCVGHQKWGVVLLWSTRIDADATCLLLCKGVGCHRKSNGCDGEKLSKKESFSHKMNASKHEIDRAKLRKIFEIAKKSPHKTSDI